MRWRLLLDGAREGAENMAIDEALFVSATAGSTPPTLRLYTWRGPCLSIGYGQVLDDVCDVEACRRLEIEVVRRITGGRAVLHHQELTYSVASPLEGVLRSFSVRRLYGWVSEALRAALARLGVQLDPPFPRSTLLQRRPRAASRLPCMAVPTGHEITVCGRKLVGSAQKRGRRSFLQHGSILLGVDASLWRMTTGLTAETDLGAVGLRDLLPRGVDEDALRRALQEAFEDLFGAPPSMTKLSAEEADKARALAVEKYASATWNLHGCRRAGAPPRTCPPSGRCDLGAR